MLNVNLFSESCRRPYPLGVSYQSKVVKDNKIKGSSEVDGFESFHARLRYPDKSWCADVGKKVKISIDFEKLVSISGVATQGYKGQVVTEYAIRYSYNAKEWYGYPNSKNPMVRIIKISALSVALLS